MKKLLLSIAMMGIMALSMQAQVSRQNALNFQHNSNHHLQPNPDRNIAWILYKFGKQVDSNWDTIANSWTFQDSIRNTYNAKGNITMKIMYYGLSYNKTVYVYNGNGKMTSDTSYYWTGSAYMKSMMSTYAYDANGNQTSNLMYYGWTGTAWNGGYGYLYTYDANNHQTQQLSQNYTSGAWVNNYKQDFTWVGNDLTEMISQTWNAGWVNDSKSDITYIGGQASSGIEYQWNGTSWANWRKIINVSWYQWISSVMDSKESTETQQVYSGGAWKDTLKYTYSYDSFGNQTDYLEQVTPSGTWITSMERKDIFQYDGNNNITQDIEQDWINAVIGLRNKYKHDYSNYQMFTAISELSQDALGIKVYPNPTTGKLTINAQSPCNSIVEMYNILGAKVFQSASELRNSTIDISSSPSGIYFLKIITKEGNIMKKIVKD